ncbi:hypothetical protein ATERTT37_007807 [Aspergillus terreus]
MSSSRVLDWPAGFATQVTLGPTTSGIAEEYELVFARRALSKIKARLGLEATERLLQPDIDESNAFWRQVLADNPTNEFRPARVELAINGLSMDEFLGWFRERCQNRVPWMPAAQPEHWVVVSPAAAANANADGGSSPGYHEKVNENLGPWISRFFITFAPPSHACQLGELDAEAYPLQMTGYGRTDGGQINGYVLHQFRPHANSVGFDANLCIHFPAPAPEVLFEQHRQHLVVEFTNRARHCYRDTKVETF